MCTFQKAFLKQGLKFLIGHTWFPYFSKAQFVISILSKSPIKLKRKQELSTRIILRKEWSEHRLTNIIDSEFLKGKKKVYRGELDMYLAPTLLQIVRIRPNSSCKSSVLHT